MSQWKIDPTHSAAGFSARHMMITTVRGEFKNVEGTVNFDPEHPENASVEAVIHTDQMSSTGVVDRDNHLRSEDFLNVEKYPTMTFKSTKVEVTGENTAKITGDLTIRDVTGPVTINAEFLGQGSSPFGDTRAGFAGTTTINREEFGLTWNVALESGGWLVGKDIKITLDVEAILVTEAQPA
ncbi:MAG: YceI family protein [Anaerolineae bacterium]|nr:YceI family protein [Anaerolineae bacterium]